jgi:hypothetical protein
MDLESGAARRLEPAALSLARPGRASVRAMGNALGRHHADQADKARTASPRAADGGDVRARGLSTGALSSLLAPAVRRARHGGGGLRRRREAGAAAVTGGRRRYGARRSVLLIAVVALGLAGCRDTKPYTEALDSLALPASWEVVKTLTQPSTDVCVNCPQVLRYYVATGELTDLLEELKAAVTNAGFASLQIGSPTCELNDNTGLACTVTATKNDIRLLGIVYRPGSDVDSLGLSQPGKSTLRITVTNK